MYTIAEPSVVVPTIAQALGVKETGGLSSEEALERFLHDRELLLVLDNLEHLLDAAPTIAQLLADVPPLKALVTSRAPLRVAGEYDYALDPLAEDEAGGAGVPHEEAMLWMESLGTDHELPQPEPKKP